MFRIRLRIRQTRHFFRYYCDQCGKGFQMNCLLVRHETRAHTHIKPFKCPMCEKSFKTKRDLKIHMDSHDPSKNYICNQCGKYRRTYSNEHFPERYYHGSQFQNIYEKHSCETHGFLSQNFLS